MTLLGVIEKKDEGRKKEATNTKKLKSRFECFIASKLVSLFQTPPQRTCRQRHQATTHKSKVHAYP